MSQLLRAGAVIESGQLTRLQRQTLVALLLAVAIDPVGEPLATILGSALDALAPRRPAAPAAAIRADVDFAGS